MESRSHKAESDGSYPEPKAAYTCICRNDSCKQRIPCVHCRILPVCRSRKGAACPISKMTIFWKETGMLEEEKKEELLALLSGKKYRELKSQLVEMNEVDIASFIEELDSEKTVVVFRMLPKELASEVFACLEVEQQQHIITSITDNELRAIIDDLYVDDAVDMLEELPATIVRRVLQNSSPDTRKLINQFLNYPENSAGSVMTAEYVGLKKNMTVEQAFDYIRKYGVDKETIYTCYVMDEKRRLEGVVTVKDLLMNDYAALMGDIMDPHVIKAYTTEDQEKVVETFNEYNLLSLPVVDGEDRLVGIITVDDIVDVIEQETTEDMELMNAVLPSDDEYLKMSVFALVKNRIPWLCVLMISGTLSAFVIGMYQSLLDSVVMLSSFMTIITGTGGNAGSQDSAMVIRGLALGDIQMRDTFKVVFKELRVGILCGLILAMVNMIRMTFFDHSTPFNIDLTVSISMGVAVVLAKTLGCILPILAKAVKLDPAMMAGPLISTVVDAIALVVYFSIATVLVL